MREIRESDYSQRQFELIASLHNSAYPDLPTTGEDLARDFAIRDKSLLREFYLYGDIGYIELGDAYWFNAPGKTFARFESQSERSDAELLDFSLCRLRQFNGTRVLTFSREHRPARTELLTSNGFKLVQVEPISRLEPSKFNFEFASRYEKRARDADAELITLKEFAERDPRFSRKLYAHASSSLAEVPAPDPIEPLPFEVWQLRLENPLMYDFEIFVVAIHAGEIVGTSGLHPCPADRKILFTGLTGVRSDFRRHGLATAMKAKAARIAAQRGVTAVMTDNDEGNPMFQLNQLLGFECIDKWLHYEREL